MFVRTRQRAPDRTQVQIVESVRQGAQVKQKLIRNVGVAASEQELDQFKAIAEAAIIELKNRRKPVLPFVDPKEVHAPRKKAAASGSIEDSVRVKNIRHEHSFNDGFSLVFGALYERLGFDNVLMTKRKRDYWNAMLKSMVIARIADPTSKRATRRNLEEKFDETYDLDAIYALMDHIHDNDKRIKDRVLDATKTLFREKIDVLFFDVTTLYFESIRSDDLRNFGFSKDCKFKETQVVLALITTTGGLPITYKLFPGNTNEGKTLIATVQELQKEFELNRVVMAADRAMFSDENLANLDALGVRYVVAAKLKSMSKIDKQRILDARNYSSLKRGDDYLWIGEFEHKGRRLITSLSYDRAEKDAADRQRIVNRLLQKVRDGKIGVKDLIPNHGTKRFINIEGATAKLNEAKIEEDSHWDGLHGIVTNDRDASVGELLGTYHGLWQIEESFRVNKHTLRMRPIYHWTPKRIRAHVTLCFLAFALGKQCVELLGRSALPISLTEIRYRLASIEQHRIIDVATSKRYLIPSALSRDQIAILKKLNIERANEPAAG